METAAGDSAATGSSRAPPPKVYDYIPPRLDPDLYQAAVPAWDGEVLADNRRVPKKKPFAAASYSAEYAPSEPVQQFLAFSRTLTKGTEADLRTDVPLEADAPALEFFASLDYDVDRANFVLYSQMGMGKDLHLTQLATAFIDKHPVSALFNEYKERVLRATPCCFLGSYGAVADVSVVASDSAPDPSVVAEEEKEVSFVRTSHRVQGGEKAEAKRRWLALLDATISALTASKHSSNRLNLRGAQALLDEAVSISVPFTTALGSAGSAAQAAEDFASMEKLRTNLGEVVKRVVLSREWLGEARDLLRRKSANVVINENTTRRPVFTLTQLGELLRRGDSLDFVCTDADAQVRRIQTQLVTAQQAIKSFMADLKHSFFTGYHLIQAPQDATTDAYTAKQIEERLCTHAQCVLDAPRQDDVFILLLSPSDLVEGSTVCGDEEAGHSLRAPRRLVLSDLEALLASAPPGVLITELAYFSFMLAICARLSERCRTIVNAFDFLRKKEKVQESDKKRLYAYLKVRRFAAALQRFPIDLPVAGELTKLLERVAAWQQEVRGLASVAGGAGESRRSSRRGKDDGRAVSMKKVDALLAEGLRYPFSLETEIAILRDKKDQAKLWLDKLKKTFGMTKRSHARKSQDDSDANKLSLAEMRMLVEAGTTMYVQEEEGEDDDAAGKKAPRSVLRDLDRAAGLVESAADWVRRVRTAVSAHFAMGYRGLGLPSPLPPQSDEQEEASAPAVDMDVVVKLEPAMFIPVAEKPEPEASTDDPAIDPEDEEILLEERRDLSSALTALLEEADSMPVVLEETEGLRLQLRALDWAMRHRRKLIQCIELRKVEESVSLKSALDGRQEDVPTYSDLVEMRGEIVKIRDKWDELEVDMETSPLAEEVCLQALLVQADRLVQAVRKGRELRKGQSLQGICDLLIGGRALPLSLDLETKVPRQAVIATLQWLLDHAQSIGALGLWVTEDWDLLHRAGLVEDEQPPRCATDGTLCSFENFDRLAKSATQCPVDFPTLRAVRSRGAAVQTWLAKVKSLAKQFSDLLSGGVRRRRPGGEDGGAERERDDLLSDLPHDFSFLPSFALPTLQLLLEEASALGVYLGNEMDTVKAVHETITAWEERSLAQCGEVLDAVSGLVLNEALQSLQGQRRAFHLPHLEGMLLNDQPVPLARLAPFPITSDTGLVLALHGICMEGVRMDCDTLTTQTALAYRQLLLIERMARGVLMGSQACDADGHYVQPWGDTPVELAAQLGRFLEEVRAALLGEGSSTLSSPEGEELLVRFRAQADLVLAQPAPAARDDAASPDPDQPDPDAQTLGSLAEGLERSDRGTRSSQGINKRKRDDDFADSSRIHILRGIETAPSPQPAAAPPSSSKKRRSSAAAASAASVVVVTAPQAESDEGAALAVLMERSGVSIDTPAMLSALAARRGRSWAGSVVVRLLDLHRTALRHLQERLEEVRRWRDHVAAARAAGGDGLVACVEAAALRGLRCSDRTQLEEQLVFSRGWLARAQAMLRGERSALLDMEALRDFVRDGDRCAYPHGEETQRLRAELKKAKQWKASFDHYLSAAQGSGAATPAHSLDELLQQAAVTLCDLTTFTDSVSQSSKRYCLCRQLYHGQMIGCDSCDDWFHFTCVNLNFTQAEKCDKYICIRCALRSSMGRAANAAAMISNKWNDKMGVLRNRDQQIEKLTKKVDKLEREKLLIGGPFKAFATPTPTPAAPVPVPVPVPVSAFASAPATQTSETASAATETIPAPLSAPAAAEVLGEATFSSFASAVALDKHTALSSEIEALKGQLVQTRKDRFREALKYKDIVLFMYALQRLLWCSNGGGPGEDRDRERLTALGAPFDPCAPAFFPFPATPPSTAASSLAGAAQRTPSDPDALAFLFPQRTAPEPTAGGPDEAVAMDVAPADAAPAQLITFDPADQDFGSAMRRLSHYLAHLLPLGGRELQTYAHQRGLGEVEDILVLLDALKWISWCACALHVLRFPPPTPLLRGLIDATRSLRFSDDKVVKFLANVAARAGSWKAKVRKYAQQGKKLDEAKLQAMALEAAALPFSSRLKAIAKRLADKSTAPTDAEGPKRLAAAKSFKAAAAATAHSTTTYTGKTVLADLPDSSDEEDNYQLDACTPPTAQSVRHAWSAGWARRMSYPEDAELAAGLAPAPTLLWPPNLSLRMAHSAAATL